MRGVRKARKTARRSALSPDISPCRLVPTVYSIQYFQTATTINNFSAGRSLKLLLKKLDCSGFPLKTSHPTMCVCVSYSIGRSRSQATAASMALAPSGVTL